MLQCRPRRIPDASSNSRSSITRSPLLFRWLYLSRSKPAHLPVAPTSVRAEMNKVVHVTQQTPELAHLFPLGDGRWSSGKPLPPPVPDREDELRVACLRPGARVWWYRLGEWVEVWVRGGTRSNGFLVQRVLDDATFQVAPCSIRTTQPVDCGRMRPPTGAAGIAYWKGVDPTIFD